MDSDGDAIYWLYLVSRGHSTSLARDMRSNLVDRGWIEAEAIGNPVMTALGKAVMDAKGCVPIRRVPINRE